MDIKITLLIVAFFNFLLAWTVYSQGKKKLDNILFALLTLTTGVWAVVLYLYERPLFFSSLVWIKLTYLDVFFLMFFLFYFSFIFTAKE